jgi:hypothetical protein
MTRHKRFSIVAAEEVCWYTWVNMSRREKPQLVVSQETRPLRKLKQSSSSSIFHNSKIQHHVMTTLDNVGSPKEGN